MRPARLPLVAAMLASAGCLEFRAVDLLIDLRKGTAEVRYRDLRGEGEGTFTSLIAEVIPGTTFEEPFPGAVVQSEEPVANGQALDVLLRLRFETPADMGLLRWDSRHPYRYCPPPELLVVQANATGRDADGCLVWRRGTRILRVHAESRRPSNQQSLLPFFEQWVGAGRPALEVAQPPSGSEQP